MSEILSPVPERTRLSGRVARALWSVAVLDMAGVAWVLVLGEWLDGASPITSVMTLGGRHDLVLSLAAAGFLLLMALAWQTKGFREAGRIELGLIVVGCTASIVALAGALSALLLVLIVALVLGLLFRPPRR